MSLAGSIALSIVLLRVWYPTRDENKVLKRRTVAQVVGWYWHFMDGVWLVLFLLLGFGNSEWTCCRYSRM